MKFIQELHEGIFFSKGPLDKLNFQEVADLILIEISALTAMKWDPAGMKFAVQYARSTMQYNNFDHFRSTGTHLYNLIWALTNKDKSKSMLSDPEVNEILANRIHIPELQLKHWLKDLAAGRSDQQQDQAFLLRLERDLKITEMDYRAVRRLVQDWPDLSVANKKLAVTRIRQMLNSRSAHSDLAKAFDSWASKNKYVIANVCDPETGENCSPKGPSTLGSITKGLGKAMLAFAAGAAIGYAITKKRSKS